MILIPQAMERRYTALAEEQGKLAAEKERLLSENKRLTEVSCVGCFIVHDMYYFNVHAGLCGT
jgi:hypothetical protein